MSYLFEEEVLDATEEFYGYIKAALDAHHEAIPEDSECMMHVDFDDEGEQRECYYYMVNHQTRVLFWLNPFEAAAMLDDVDNVTDPSHISKHRITSIISALRIAASSYRTRA